MSETISDYFTIAQTAEKLQVSPNTIRNLITRGDLKAERIGRIIRIRKENLDALLTPYSGGEFGVWK
jgi:excisionase family DNA binding protein